METNITIGIFSIIAMLVSPLIAVQVTKYLDQKKEEKKRQEEIFRILMGQRGLSPRTDEYLIALNQIDVVFHNSESVRQAYAELYKVTKPNHPEISDSGVYLIVLLQKMAEYLKYDKFRDLDIDKYYSTQSRADSQNLLSAYYREFYRVLSSSEHFGMKSKNEKKKKKKKKS